MWDWILARSICRLFFDPPAIVILGGCFGVIFVGGGIFLVDHDILQEGNRSLILLASATGLAIIGLDVWYRRSNALSLFSIKASTVFFVIPTWAVGVAVLIAGLRWWA